MEKSLSMDCAELRAHLKIVKSTFVNNSKKYFFGKKTSL